jgi:hypothetical protein
LRLPSVAKTNNDYRDERNNSMSQQRPTSVTVFGVINIIFGGFAIICLPIGLLMSAGLVKFQHNPVMDMLSSSRVWQIWNIVSGILGILSGIVQLIAGIGLLKLKSWARITSVGYAIFAIIVAVANMFLTAILFLPMIQKMNSGSGPEHAATVAGMIGGIIGGLGGSCFQLIYPILLLIFMTRPKVKAAFVAPQE